MDYIWCSSDRWTLACVSSTIPIIGVEWIDTLTPPARSRAPSSSSTANVDVATRRYRSRRRKGVAVDRERGRDCEDASTVLEQPYSASCRRRRPRYHTRPWTSPSLLHLYRSSSTPVYVSSPSTCCVLPIIDLGSLSVGTVMPIRYPSKFHLIPTTYPPLHPISSDLHRCMVNGTHILRYLTLTRASRLIS